MSDNGQLSIFVPGYNLGRRAETQVTTWVAALCVSSNSIYKKLPNVEAFDMKRDARTFAGGMPVVAHPPCRAWSAYTAHQAKPAEGEVGLGLWCCEQLREHGGVLEQPAHSRLFDAASLPKPGWKHRRDFFALQVLQAWWGYPMRKATWLCFAKINFDDLPPIPHVDHDSRAGVGDRRRQQLMSKNQRAATNRPFAEWLLSAARMAR